MILTIIAIVLVLWLVLAVAAAVWLMLPAPERPASPRELADLPKRLTMPPPKAAPPQPPTRPANRGQS
jgi:hypothetical protein